MAQSARVITEDEEDRLDAGATPASSPGAAGPEILGTGADVPGSRTAVGRETVPQFDIVEVDSEDADLPGSQQPAGPAAAEAAPAPEDTSAAGADDQQSDEDGQSQPRYGKKWSERQRRKEGRERTIAENRALKGEVAELRQQIQTFAQQFETTVQPRLQELSDGQVRHQLSVMENQLADADRTYTSAEDLFFNAMSSGDMDAARRHLRDRDEAALKRIQIRGAKDGIEQTLAARRAAPASDPAAAAPMQPRFNDGGPRFAPQPQERPLAPAAVEYSQEFMGDVPWLNQPGTERDSRMLLRLDNDVAADGFDPSTPDYWDELMERARTYIPHRFAAAAAPAPRAAAQPARQGAPPAQPQRRGPPTGAPGETAGAPRPNQVRITPERRSALEEAGVIDSYGKVVDTKKFNRIAAGYADIDRANGAGR